MRAVKGGAENMIGNDKTRYPDSKHTFYTGTWAMSMLLDDVDFFIGEGFFKKEGLVLICDDCNNEFIFGSKILKELKI